jgi:hypothetical protein
LQLNVPEIELWKISFKAAIRSEAFKGQDGTKVFIFLLDKGMYSFRCHIPHYDYKGKFRGLKAVTCWTNWTSQIDQSDGSLRCDILSLSAGGPKRPESAALSLWYPCNALEPCPTFVSVNRLKVIWIRFHHLHVLLSLGFVDRSHATR